MRSGFPALAEVRDEMASFEENKVAGEQTNNGKIEAKPSGLDAKPAPPPLKVNLDGGSSLPNSEEQAKTPMGWRIWLLLGLLAMEAVAGWIWLALR